MSLASDQTGAKDFAIEDRGGKYWIPFYRNANKIARLNTVTGADHERVLHR